jgi:transposase
MKKQSFLSRKIKRFLKKIGCPRFLHHFGPKKYEIAEHIHALMLKEVCKMSLRRLTNFLKMLGINCPTYSALCKSRKRIPNWIWNNLIKISSYSPTVNVAIDGTCFSRTNPSSHYLNRIGRRIIECKSPTKLSAFFDIDTRKFCAIKIRVKVRHDIKDVQPLLRKFSNFAFLFGDSAYDAEALYESCFEKKIQTIIKPKKNVKKGFYRRKQRKNFDEKVYHKRSLIESGFGSLKRKYGGTILAKKQHGIKSEIYCKAISHNLNLLS